LVVEKIAVRKDTSCQWLQGWDHFARHARNVQLIRSRRMSKRYVECQSDSLLLVIIRIGNVLQKVTGLTANGGF
jgi:hypothetical protein